MRLPETKVHRIHELADENAERAKTALDDLLKLGASTIALSVAAVLTSPLASVRDTAAKLLMKTLVLEKESAQKTDIYNLPSERLQPNTAEFDELLSYLIGSRLVDEPEPSVRREMIDVLVQLNTQVGFEYLANLANELPTKLSTHLGGLAVRFREHTNRLDHLASLIGQHMKPAESQLLYSDRLSKAVASTRQLNEYLNKIRGGVLTADGIEDINPTVRSLVNKAAEAINACNDVFKSSDSLVVSLSSILGPLQQELASELSQIKSLEDELNRINGATIADASGQATIRIKVDT